MAMICLVFLRDRRPAAGSVGVEKPPGDAALLLRGAPVCAANWQLPWDRVVACGRRPNQAAPRESAKRET